MGRVGLISKGKRGFLAPPFTGSYGAGVGEWLGNVCRESSGQSTKKGSKADTLVVRVGSSSLGKCTVPARFSREHSNRWFPRPLAVSSSGFYKELQNWSLPYLFFASEDCTPFLQLVLCLHAPHSHRVAKASARSPRSSLPLIHTHSLP